MNEEKLTKEFIKNQGFVFKNGLFLKNNIILTYKNNNIKIIRKINNYPTLFEGKIFVKKEFLDLLKKLDIK